MQSIVGSKPADIHHEEMHQSTESYQFGSNSQRASGDTKRRQTLANTLSSAAWALAPISLKRRVYLRKQQARARDAAASWNDGDCDDDDDCKGGWLAGVVWTSLTEGFGLSALQDRLQALLLTEATNARLPYRWNILEQLVVEARATFNAGKSAPPIMKWGEFCREFELAAGLSSKSKNEVDSEENLHEAATVLHAFGILHFDPLLRSNLPSPPKGAASLDHDGSLLMHSTIEPIVVLDPKWLADVFSCLITFRHSFVESRHGVVDATLLSMIWAAYPPHLHSWLMLLMVHFELAFLCSAETEDTKHADSEQLCIDGRLKYPRRVQCNRCRQNTRRRRTLRGTKLHQHVP